MSLQAFPVELLDQVLELTLPHGIESLALTCSAIYKCADSHIKRHNALKQQWKHTLHSGDPLVVIHELVRSPLAGQYIEWLDLWDRRHARREHAQPSHLSGQSMETVREAVMAWDVLRDIGGDAAQWWEMMQNEQADSQSGESQTAPYTTVFLLSMLPNLKKLQLAPAWAEVSLGDFDSPEAWVITLDAIGQRANKPGGSGNPLALLEHVLPCMTAGYEETAGILCLQPFMLLKAIAHMDFVSCLALDDGFTNIPYKWRYPNLSSPLRRVEFAFCCMDADGVSELLAHTPLLQAFRYSHQPKQQGAGYEWNPGSFIDAIASLVGESLTDLAITVDACAGGIVNGASSFVRFPKLKTLEVDTLIFRGPGVESGQRQGSRPYVPEGDIPWSVGDIPCIGGILPSSIVEVQLNTDFPTANITILNVILKNFIEERSVRLTSLTRFVIREYNSNTCLPTAQRCGIEFDCYKREGRGAIVRAMMPFWKREFEARVDEDFQ